MPSSYSSAARAGASLVLWILTLPIKAVVGFIMAVFFPPEPPNSTGYQKPVGYWWQDKKWQWHPRVYMYRKGEPPPG